MEEYYRNHLVRLDRDGSGWSVVQIVDTGFGGQLKCPEITFEGSPQAFAFARGIIDTCLRDYGPAHLSVPPKRGASPDHTGRVFALIALVCVAGMTLVLGL